MFRSVTQAAWDFNNHDCMSSGAAIAYYSIFALPPLLVIVFMLAAAAGVTQEQFDRVVAQQLGMPAKARISGPEVDRNASATPAEKGGPDAQGGATQSVSGDRSLFAMAKIGTLKQTLGLAVLIFTATGLFSQLQYAFNRVWEVQPNPRVSIVRYFLVKRLLSLGMVIVIAFLLLVSLIISAAVSQIVAIVQGAAPGPFAQAVGFALDNLVTLGLGTLLFAAMFKVLPDAKLAWRDMWLGAAVTALLFVIGKSVIAWYLKQANLGVGWGDAAGSIIAVLAWLYYTSLIVLFGAELTQVWSKRYGQGAPPVEGAVHAVQETRIEEES
jgi:membrane protein